VEEIKLLPEEAQLYTGSSQLMFEGTNEKDGNGKSFATSNTYDIGQSMIHSAMQHDNRSDVYRPIASRPFYGCDLYMSSSVRLLCN